MTIGRVCVSLAFMAALAACGGEKPSGAERKGAAGEVLGGTISDDMLPLDTLRSQAPPLRATEGVDEDDQATGNRSGTSRAPADEPRTPASAPASEPAASPTETPEPAE